MFVYAAVLGKSPCSTWTTAALWSNLIANTILFHQAGRIVSPYMPSSTCSVSRTPANQSTHPYNCGFHASAALRCVLATGQISRQLTIPPPLLFFSHTDKIPLSLSSMLSTVKMPAKVLFVDKHRPTRNTEKKKITKFAVYAAWRLPPEAALTRNSWMVFAFIISLSVCLSVVSFALTSHLASTIIYSANDITLFMCFHWGLAS